MVHFCNSMMRIGNSDIPTVYIHCVLFSGTNLKMSARVGTNTTPTCKVAPNKKAPIKYYFQIFL